MAEFNSANAKQNQAKSVLSRRKFSAICKLPDAKYLRRRVYETREKLIRVGKLWEETTDPNELDRLASVELKLTEVEQRVARRPGAGTEKPGSTKVKSHSLPPPE